MTLRPSPSRRGSALLVTLAVLVLITILVVGLSNTMRIERVSAHSHLERSRATDFAQMAAERVVGQLHGYTTGTDTNWATSPGALYVGDGNSNVLSKSIDLFSGVGDMSLTGELRPPDLNISRVMNTSSRLITDQLDTSGNAVSLPVQWIYVRRDGSLDFNQTPDLSDPANPVTGRFAYWVDDESCKLNYNIAWRRGQSSFDRDHPVSNHLPSIHEGGASFSDQDADDIHNAITSNNFSTVSGFFNSPLDARRLGGDISDTLNANRFALTHYNSDPDTNVFGRPRIVLTTQESLAPRDSQGNLLTDPVTDAPLFLDILKTPNVDPGVLSVASEFDQIDPDKLNKTLQLLLHYLQRTDWPMTLPQGGSFESKYQSANPKRLTQLALNIIDYVRARESAQPLIQPLRGRYTGTDFLPEVAYQTGSFMSTGRTPLITEIGASVNESASSGGGTTYSLRMLVELYLPPNYGLASVDLQNLSLAVNYDFPSTTVQGGDNDPILASECSSGTTVLNAGQYVTINRWVSGVNWTGFVRRSTVGLRATLSLTPGLGRLDCAPVVTNGQPLIQCTLAPSGTPFANIPSSEVDDPRVNKVYQDWHPCLTTNTFDQPNSISTLGQIPGSVAGPQQDTDVAGRLTDASLYMPPPKGTVGNPTGRVGSVGELGFITTGMESSTDPADPTAHGVPWRTIRLQPTTGTTSTQIVPDWALLDLFRVPSEPSADAKPLFRPHDTATGGRVNLNARIEPFGDPDKFTPPLERLTPLVAALEGLDDGTAHYLNNSEAQTLARAITDHTLSTGTNPGKTYGDSSLKLYDTAGEVVEIKGVADRGEVSEALVRQLANLTTTRANVFTIYSIGQSLRQTSGGLSVTGEQRSQVMVERLRKAGAHTVEFRTVYSRSLTP